MLLGCYRTGRPGPQWVPVTLSGDLPAYLVSPLEVYSPATLAREGLAERAAEEGCLPRLLGASLLPHGGGYHYPDLTGVPVEVDDPGPDGPRRFRVPGRTGWFRDVRDLPYTYRGEEVIRRIEDLGAGRVASRLEVVHRLEG